MTTFVLIGHCGPDSHLLKHAVARAVPGAAVAAADDHASLAPHLSPDRVLLINRVLSDGFDTSSGIELIERLAQRDAPPRMLLVSNHADAQQQAMTAGAMPGFGKKDVHAPLTATLLREAAGVASAGAKH